MLLRYSISVILALGVLGAMAACGPGKGGKSIPIRRTLGKGGVAEQCISQLPRGRAQKTQATRDVTVCRFNWEANQALSAETDEAKAQRATLDAQAFPSGAAYAPVKIQVKSSAQRSERPAQFRRDRTRDIEPERNQNLGRNSRARDRVRRTSSSEPVGTATINVRALIRFHNDVPNARDAAEAVRALLLRSECEKRIERIWERGRAPVRLDVRLDVEGPGNVSQPLLDEREYDQIVMMRKLPDADGQARVGLELWPFHSDVVLNAESRCRAHCESSRSQQSQSQCENSCQRALAQPLCQSLAKLAAHWAGARDPMAESGCATPTDNQHPLRAAGVVTAGYLKPAGGLTALMELIDRKQQSMANSNEGGGRVADSSNSVAPETGRQQQAAAESEGNPERTVRATLIGSRRRSTSGSADLGLDGENPNVVQSGADTTQTRTRQAVAREPLDAGNFWHLAQVTGEIASDMLRPFCRAPNPSDASRGATAPQTSPVVEAGVDPAR